MKAGLAQAPVATRSRGESAGQGQRNKVSKDNFFGVRDVAVLVLDKRRRPELVRFDTQALENPEIGGVEYQQGTLGRGNGYGYNQEDAASSVGLRRQSPPR
jgi:hypothetical protein